MRFRYWIIPIILTAVFLTSRAYAVTGDLTYFFYDSVNKILRPASTISSTAFQVTSLKSAPCVGTNASGTLISAACGTGGGGVGASTVNYGTFYLTPTTTTGTPNLIVSNNGLTFTNATATNFYSTNVSSTNASTSNFFVNVISFDTSTPVTITPGMLAWNPTDGTLNLGSEFPNVVNQIGEELWVRVVNKTGSTITNGQAVYLSGAQGNRVTASLAIATSTVQASVVGVATMDISNNQEGFVTTNGEIHGIDTRGYTAGDKLFLSPTVPGGLTTTEPVFPNYSVQIGFVENSTVNGTLYVKPLQPHNHVTINGTDGLNFTFSSPSSSINISTTSANVYFDVSQALNLTSVTTTNLSVVNTSSLFLSLAPTASQGDMLYFDGSAWRPVPSNPVSTTLKFLSQFNSSMPTWQTVPSQGTYTYYFRAVSSTSGNYLIMNSPTTSMVSKTFPASAVTTTITQWITNTSSPSLTSIPEGLWTIHIDATKTAGTKDLRFYFDVYKWNGGVETLLFTSQLSRIITGTDTVNPDEIDLEVVTSTIALDINDRLVARVYAVPGGTGTNPSGAVYFGGISEARISLPSPTVDATTFVPYTGATKNIDLGSFGLTFSNATGTSITSTNLYVSGQANILNISSTTINYLNFTNATGTLLKVNTILATTGTYGYGNFTSVTTTGLQFNASNGTTSTITYLNFTNATGTLLNISTILATTGTYGYGNFTSVTTTNLKVTNCVGCGTASAAGNDTEVQWNENGAFGASSTFTFNSSTKTLSAINFNFTNATGTTLFLSGLFNFSTGTIASTTINTANINTANVSYLSLATSSDYSRTFFGTGTGGSQIRLISGLGGQDVFKVFNYINGAQMVSIDALGNLFSTSSYFISSTSTNFIATRATTTNLYVNSGGLTVSGNSTLTTSTITSSTIKYLNFTTATGTSFVFTSGTIQYLNLTNVTSTGFNLGTGSINSSTITTANIGTANITTGIFGNATSTNLFSSLLQATNLKINTYSVVATGSPGFNVSSTTISSYGSLSASTTIWLPPNRMARTIVGIDCYTDSGTSTIEFGDGTNWTETITCGQTTGKNSGVLTNGAFTADEHPAMRILFNKVGTPNQLMGTVYYAY